MSKRLSDVATERKVVGAALTDRETALFTLARIESQLFTLPMHRAIISAVQLIISEGEAIDPILVYNRVCDSGMQIPPELTLELADEAAAGAALNQHIRTLKEMAERRLCEQIIPELSEITDDPDKFARLLSEKADELKALRADGSAPNFIDLGDLVRQGLQRELPTIVRTFDSNFLLYAGRLNEIHAEPSVGKSNVACACVVSIVKAGGMALYIDPEDTPQGIASRLVSFGLTDAELSNFVRYAHNPAPSDYDVLQQWAKANRCALTIVDGLAEALAADGLNEDKPGDVLQFFKSRLRPFAEAGSAVLISDHVTKNTETRGRWARGSGAKLGRYDGAVYSLTLGEPYTPEKAGVVRLTISKDRVGGIGVAGQMVAELHLTPENYRTRVEWTPPEAEGRFRPTALMAKIIRYLKLKPDASKREIRNLGKAQYVDQAIRCLVEDGRLQVFREGKANRFEVVPEV